MKNNLPKPPNSLSGKLSAIGDEVGMWVGAAILPTFFFGIIAAGVYGANQFINTPHPDLAAGAANLTEKLRETTVRAVEGAGYKLTTRPSGEGEGTRYTAVYVGKAPSTQPAEISH